MDPGSWHGSRKMKGVHSQEWIATWPVELRKGVFLPLVDEGKF
jgi:hypothetical protein